MTAPEEQHIVGLGGVDDFRQTAGRTAQEDVAQVVGAVQIAEVIVHHGILAQVGIHQRVIGIGLFGTVNIDFTRQGILLVVGQIVLDDEHDMVVIVAVVAQQLIDGKGVGLMAVVVPSGAGTDHDGPALADGGQMVVDIGTEVGVDVEYLALPVPNVLHGEAAVLRGRDNGIGHIRAVTRRLPQHIERVEGGRVGLRVEVEVAGSTAQVGPDARFQQLESLSQTVAYPKGLGGALVVGKDGAHPVAEHRTVGGRLVCHAFVVDIQFIGVLGVCLSRTSYGEDAQCIVDLGGTERCGGIVLRLVALQIAVDR